MEIRSDIALRHVGPTAATPAAAPVAANGAAVGVPRDRAEIGAVSAPPAVPAAAPSDLVSRLGDDFSIREGHQVNYFTSCGDASAHTVVTDATKPRILVTYPDMNSGTGFWLKPGTNLQMTAPPRSIRTEHGQGVTAEVVADGPRMTIREVILGSVRTMRDERVPGAADDVRRLREDAAGRVGAPAGWAREQVRVVDGHVLDVERTALNGHPFRLQLDFPPGTQIAVKGPHDIEVAAPDGKHLRFGVRSELPYQELHRYPPEKLLRPATLDALRSLDAQSRTAGADALAGENPPAGEDGKVQDRSSNRRAEDRDHFFAALRGLEFLSRHEKFMAGAWRFMTYFGRDTMLSLMLLQDAVTPQAYRDGIQSVLDRLAPNGDVAHEEDIGPWAEVDRLREAEKHPGMLHGESAAALDSPVYDYKMVDDDLLLPIMAARYLADPAQPQEERRAFLMHRGPSGQTNLQRLVDNWNFNLGRLERYAHSLDASRPEGDFHDLVRIHEGQRVGNWRDSAVGLAGGVYPEDVNVDLAVGALRGMRDVLKSGIVSQKDLANPPAREDGHLQDGFPNRRAGNPPAREDGHLQDGFPNRRAGNPPAREDGLLQDGFPNRKAERRDSPPLPGLDRLVGAWERAHACFDERLSPDRIRTRLATFLARSNPSDAERRYFDAIQFSDGSTLQQFLAGGPAPPELRGGLKYTALSLDSQGHPMAIPNTDFGFRLFLGKPTPGEIDDMLKWLELPYPVGLMTPVGPVVANAAYSDHPQHWKLLDNDAYHGAVVWSWQMSMLEMGLLDQIARFQDDASQQPPGKTGDTYPFPRDRLLGSVTGFPRKLGGVPSFPTDSQGSSDAHLVQRMQQAVTRLEDARRAAGPLANSELWTWDVRDGRMVGEAFGQRATSETESNAVQLWSTVYPAIWMKRQAVAR